MILLRIFMTVFFLVINFLEWDMYIQTKNTPSGLGGGFYILGYFVLSIITTITIAIKTDFKNFKKSDTFLFVLCTPISFISAVFLSNIII
jgi:hypothetical protein